MRGRQADVYWNYLLSLVVTQAVIKTVKQCSSTLFNDLELACECVTRWNRGAQVRSRQINGLQRHKDPTTACRLQLYLLLSKNSRCRDKVQGSSDLNSEASALLRSLLVRPDDMTQKPRRRSVFQVQARWSHRLPLQVKTFQVQSISQMELSKDPRIALG